MPGDVLARVEPSAYIRLMVYHRRMESHVARDQLRVIEIHRVVGRGRCVGCMRIQVKHPEKELLVSILVDEAKCLGHERWGMSPGNGVRLDPIRRLRDLVDRLEDIEPLIEARASFRPGQELVDDDVAGKPAGYEPVVMQDLHQRRELLQEPPPGRVDPVAI